MIPEHLDPAAVRELDRITIEDFGLPGRLLMEVAGFGAFQHLKSQFATFPTTPRVVVLAGHGNNGGDGFVLARWLHCAEIPVEVQMVAAARRGSSSSDSEANRALLPRFGVPCEPVQEPRLGNCDLIVDALLGSGLKGAVRSPYAEAIRCANASGLPTFSLDVPSGLDALSGQPLGTAINARWTVTFGCVKTGLLQAEAKSHVGELFFVPLCFPPEAFPPSGRAT